MNDQVKDQIAEFIKQTEQMQENLKKIQQKLAQTVVKGESGAGLVSVELTCKYEVRQLFIDDSLITTDKKKMLVTLVIGAFNDAARKIEATVQQNMDSVTNSLKMPSRLQPPPFIST